MRIVFATVTLTLAGCAALRHPQVQNPVMREPVAAVQPWSGFLVLDTTVEPPWLGVVDDDDAVLTGEEVFQPTPLKAEPSHETNIFFGIAAEGVLVPLHFMEDAWVFPAPDEIRWIADYFVVSGEDVYTVSDAPTGVDGTWLFFGAQGMTFDSPGLAVNYGSRGFNDQGQPKGQLLRVDIETGGCLGTHEACLALDQVIRASEQ